MPPFFAYSPSRSPHNSTRNGALEPHLWTDAGEGL